METDSQLVAGSPGVGLARRSARCTGARAVWEVTPTHTPGVKAAGVPISAGLGQKVHQTEDDRQQQSGKSDEDRHRNESPISSGSYGAVCTSPRMDDTKNKPKKKIAPMIAWNMRTPFLTRRSQAHDLPRLARGYECSDLSRCRQECSVIGRRRELGSGSCIPTEPYRLECAHYGVRRVMPAFSGV